MGTVVSTAWGDRPDPTEERRERRPRYSERLQSELGLTEAQRESVEVIVRRRQEAMHGIWADMRPRFDTLRLQIRSEVATLLDGDQLATYETMIAKSDSARAARNGRDGRGRHDH